MTIRATVINFSGFRQSLENFPRIKRRFLSKENDKVAEAFDKVSKYHLNNDEVRKSLYGSNLSETIFSERLYNVIRPIYDAARDSGFKEWRYEETASR